MVIHFYFYFRIICGFFQQCQSLQHRVRVIRDAVPLPDLRECKILDRWDPFAVEGEVKQRHFPAVGIRLLNVKFILVPAVKLEPFPVD